MTINLFAGQVPTADELLALATRYVAQGTAQSSTSSTTLASSAIIVPVDGPSLIELSARYTSLAGGIRWAWATNAGSVTLLARDILSAGETTSTTAGTANIADVRLRQIATLGEVQITNHFNNAGTQLIRERLVVTGTGEIVFQFAQAVSNASATTLAAQSYATVQQYLLL